MQFRRFELVLAVIALALVVALPVLAANENTVEGMVVSAAGGKLVAADKDKTELKFTVAPDAKITIDGKAAKLEDLKRGTFVRLTTKKDDKTVAMTIEAKTKEK